MNRRSALYSLAGTLAFGGFLGYGLLRKRMAETAMPHERVLTTGPGGCVLTNANVWSDDGEWVLFDTRSDAAGDRFDGTQIRAVHLETSQVRTLYQSENGAHCGVVTCHPTLPKVVCILGPENPSAEWSYGPTRRQGIVIDFAGGARNLDARDLVAPFTPGALRGGSHVHTWHPRGDWVAFTYEDEVLNRFAEPRDFRDTNQRNIGVSFPGQPVRVPKSHSRNHDGDYFSVLVTRTTPRPRIDSDDVSKAFEDAWIGRDGYLRADGSRQRRAIAFQGLVQTPAGSVAEVFVADLPDELQQPGKGPLEGTELRRPCPPHGVSQRRLTTTTHHKYPGIQGTRHWLRSSPDGSKIGFLKKDPKGIAQFWIVNPAGGDPQVVTDSPEPMASAFTWHPDGRRVACIVDGSVSWIDTVDGTVTRLTAKTEPPPRPEGCVVSPDGSKIAFVRTTAGSNQICMVEVPSG